jgi:ADP-heptose:LPS heptosyltransferase
MNRILVLAAESPDEHLLTYPFFHQLREVHANSRIEVACSPPLRKLQFMDRVDEVRVHPEIRASGEGLWSRLIAAEQLGRRLRGLQVTWDMGVSLRDDPGSTWVLKRAGVRRVHAFRDRTLEAYGAASFWPTPPENSLDEPTPGQVTQFDWKRSWPDLRQLEPPRDAYWVLAPGAADDSRQWPVERFLELSRTLRERTGLKGVVVGGPRDAPLAARLCADADTGLQNCAAQAEVPAQSRLLQGAAFVVSNDSEYANLAVLCGAPTHVIWGARDGSRYHPRGPGRLRMLMQPVSCWPCNERRCVIPGERHLQCLRQISVASVVDDIIEVWNRYGSGGLKVRMSGGAT